MIAGGNDNHLVLPVDCSPFDSAVAECHRLFLQAFDLRRADDLLQHEWVAVGTEPRSFFEIQVLEADGDLPRRVVAAPSPRMDRLLQRMRRAVR